jgi:hypothetical protein
MLTDNATAFAPLAKACENAICLNTIFKWMQEAGCGKKFMFCILEQLVVLVEL